MADFCLKCFNIINNENKTEDDVVMQWDFCERCNQNLPCVIYVKTKLGRYVPISEHRN